MRARTLIACAGIAAMCFSAPAFSQETDPNQPPDQPEQPDRPDRPDRSDRPDRPERGMRGAMGRPLDTEQAEQAWRWQAKDVAQELELSQEETEKLVEVYLASRNDLQEAAEQLRAQAGEAEEGDDARGNARGRRGGMRGIFEGYRELVEEKRVALESELTSLLKPEQVEKAIEPLGTFSRRWDMLVVALMNVSTGADQTAAALEPIRIHVLAVEELRGSGDRQAMMEGMREEREKLMKSLGEVLSEDQLEEFQRTTRLRSRGGDRGNRRPRGGPNT